MSPFRAQHRAHGASAVMRLRRAVALFFRRLETWQRFAVGAAVLATMGAVAGLVLIALPNPHTDAGSPPPTTARPVVTSSTTIPPRHARVPLCPLTGTPAPGRKVPARPALGVKVGNDPASRPQTGLLSADIVYDEMAEGGITRYLAIYQCHGAPVLGPIRSVRWDDWHLLASYGHPILAFSGGIDQWDQAVAAQSWLFDANGSVLPGANAYYRTSNRVAPWNYYTSTKALWALDPSNRPPPPQFSYSRRVPSDATPAASVTIANFDTNDSGLTNLTWTWSASRHAWFRSYGGVPDVDSSGLQLRAANVVVELVRTVPGPYAESGTVPDTESITAGTGQALVLRNGAVERGVWSCPRYGETTALRFPDGQEMTLSPGNTWVELVPENGYPVTVTP
ncbi:MAG: DUF3048 domain-containing protein [Actinomycetota bacterium]|nr:DUF3048 domain-containing protein [Actinomycetota bacterium]